MLELAILLAVLALILLYVASRQRRATGLPGGRIIYTDTRTWGRVEKPLYDATLGLTGKPDYLVQTGDQVIPVEVKSSRVNEGPYDSHIYQLAAYCYLVKQAYGKKPPYGILKYSNRTYQIDYTKELEGRLLDYLLEIRSHSMRKEIPRSHTIPARCAHCGYRTICDQRI